MKGWIREKDVREHLIDQYILCDDELGTESLAYHRLGFAAAHGESERREKNMAYWSARRKQVTEIGRRLGMNIPRLAKMMDDVPDYEPEEVRS